MDFSQLPGKYIADRNSRRLGFVVDIRSITPSDTANQKPKATMLVKIERAFRDAITVEVDVEEIIKIEGFYVWLDTTKKEFFESIKKTKSVPQERKEIKRVEHTIPIAKQSLPASEKKSIKKPAKTGELNDSFAFQEYTSGRSKKIKTPWISIIILGFSTAAVSFLLFMFGIVTVGNPYSMNMIIGLLGLPAGFIISFKNKTLDIMVSWRYSSFTGIIYTITYFVIGVVVTSIDAFGLTGIFSGMVSLILSCLAIGVYSILVTFSIGALLGTMVCGYIDDRR